VVRGLRLMVAAELQDGQDIGVSSSYEESGYVRTTSPEI